MPPSDVTTTQKTEYPQWTQDATQGLNQAGQSVYQGFVNAPAYATAGLNIDQQKSFDLARQMAQNAFTSGPTQINGSTQATAATVGAPTMATAQTLNPNDIASYMNPYMQNVINPVVTQARSDLNNQQATIGANAAAAGAFGGDREALERGLADRNYNNSVSSTVANLMAQGYSQAQAAAEADAQARQQTSLANQSAANNASLQQAAYDQAVALANPSLNLQTAQLTDALKGTNQSQELTALQALLGIGNQQQQQAQNVIDTPFTALQRLAALTPQVYDQTSSTTQPGTSPLQSILGLGLSIAGMPVAGGGSLLGNALSGI